MTTDDLKRLKRLADKARKATTERDDLIRQLRTAGLPLRTVGEAAGLSHAAIARIERRGPQEEPPP